MTPDEMKAEIERLQDLAVKFQRGGKSRLPEGANP